MEKMTPLIIDQITTRDSLKTIIFLVLTTNILSICYLFGDRNQLGDLFSSDPIQDAKKLRVARELSERYQYDDDNRITGSQNRLKVIHVIKENSYDWAEAEFDNGFQNCPNTKNCKVFTHYITKQTVPNALPQFGDCTIFTSQALDLHKQSSYWTELGKSKPEEMLWAFQSMSNPYDHSLDHLLFHNYAFNFSITYKKDSDIFSPFNFWQPYDTNLGRNPKLATRNFAANKTRKVLWQIDGDCQTANDRMKYARELSTFIPVDIIGQCYDVFNNKYRQIDYSTHKNDKRRGVITDYKFVLAFEENNCEDYVTNVFFDTFKPGQNVIPIVMGASKETYDLLGPPRSFLHVDDFHGPKELAEHLHKLDKENANFNSYFRYVGMGTFELPISTMCRVCDMINYLQGMESLEEYYTKEEFNEFWDPSTCHFKNLVLSNEL